MYKVNVVIGMRKTQDQGLSLGNQGLQIQASMIWIPSRPNLDSDLLTIHVLKLKLDGHF